jgi:hypothetical protein
MKIIEKNPFFYITNINHKKTRKNINVKLKLIQNNINILNEKKKHFHWKNELLFCRMKIVLKKNDELNGKK